MGEGTRVVEYADDELVKKLMVEISALDKRLSKLENAALPYVTQIGAVPIKVTSTLSVFDINNILKGKSFE